MSYDAYESSVESGAPIRLYEFSLTAIQWRYNTSDKQVVTLDGRVWLPAPMQDSGVKQTGESSADATTITAPDNIAPVQLFKLSPPSEVMAFTMYEKHIGDDEVVAKYVGEVAQINFTTPGVAEIICETLSATLNRLGLRLTWQRQCPHVIYDPVGCKVSKVANAEAAVVTSINGLQVEVSGLANVTAGRYTAGILEFQHPVKGRELITIAHNSGAVLTMFSSPSDLWVGLPVTVYRGCSQTPDSCKSFNNYDNYGGVPDIPGKSPFDGVESPVF